jgi:hypothetical protein
VPGTGLPNGRRRYTGGVRIRPLGRRTSVAVLIAFALMLLFRLAGTEGQPHSMGRAIAVTVRRENLGWPMPAGFLGLSTEFRGIAAYAGLDSGPVDPVFLRLVRNVAPGQRPVLRIGGDSTDWSWRPVGGLRRPTGVSYAVTDNWLRRVRAVASALDARLILGVNLAADNVRVAGAEARAFADGLGARYVSALELGNEPELYAHFPWERGPNGRPARGPWWSFDRYLGGWRRIARTLPSRSLAGPATGSLRWMSQLGRFMGAKPRVKLLTLHRYALKFCGAMGKQTIGELWSNSAADGLAASVAPTVALGPRPSGPGADRRGQLDRLWRTARGQQHVRRCAVGAGHAVRDRPHGCRRSELPHRAAVVQRAS